jgi:hypothetical protein
VAAQTTAAAAQSGPATGTWQVTSGVAYAPWTFDLTQTGTTLTGTVRQEGGLRGPASIRGGTVQGNALSFKVDSPSGGRIITFVGTLAGDSINLTRSVEDPVGELSGAGVFGVSGAMQFTAHRADPVAVARALGTTPAGGQRWVAVDGIGFPPWTFDLVIKDGAVTGSASQGTVDPATNTTTSIPGPYALVDGTADGTIISFTIKYNGGDRVVTFRGTRTGDQIDFTRSIQVVNGPAGFTGIVGAQGATHFTAKLQAPAASAPPAVEPSGALAGPPITRPAAAPEPAPVGPAGSWRVVDVPNGPWIFEFTVTGAAVTGTVREGEASSGGATIAGGTVDAASISFTVLSPDAARTIAFRGRVSGDEISFTRQVTSLHGGGKGGAGLFGAAGPTTFVARRDNPRVLSYKGFTVDTAAIATAPDREVVLDAIRAQIDLVDAVRLDGDKRRFFRTIPFVIVSSTGSAAYVGGRVTVPAHPDWAYDRRQPIFLSELLYAYEDLKVPDGFHNSAIETLYEQGRASGHFAASSEMPGNVADYFAMMATGYLIESSVPGQFSRAAIKATQPGMYRWLAKEFGSR